MGTRADPAVPHGINGLAQLATAGSLLRPLADSACPRDREREIVAQSSLFKNEDEDRRSIVADEWRSAAARCEDVCWRQIQTSASY